ncbi:hypothetical protein, partial [Helicobacter sp. 10-6591]|uniref:hypothetical protein n=1 Tax=Helicobacter sp. 10-6591 TaxID=2004998 RepID=UPI000DCB7EA1
MNTKAPINRISAITALLLGVCASSAAGEHNNPSWQVAVDGGNLSVSNTKHGSDPGITTIIANNGGSKNNLSGRIETSNPPNNNTLSSLLIENGTSIKGNNGLIVIGKDSQNQNYTIPTITNQGTLTSEGQSTVFITGQGNKTITNFTNIGTIKNTKKGDNSNENSAIRFNKDNNKQSTYSITNFSNSGLIESDKRTIVLYNTTIENFTNDGTIHSNGHNAMDMKNSTIKTFINKGLITKRKSNSDFTKGLGLSSNANIETLINNGTILAEEGNWDSSGIELQDFIDPGEISIKTLENTGLIKARNAAVHVGPIKGENNKNTITLLKNSGTLMSQKSAIELDNNSDVGENAISSIMTLQNSGVIQGHNNGVTVFFGCTIEQCHGDGKSSIDIIENTGTIIGETGVGINIKIDKDHNDTQSFKGIKPTSMTIGQIKVDGLVQGKQAGILNQGQLGSKEGEEAIIVGTNGRIQGGFKNDKDGILQGDITNNGKSELALDNKGKVSNNTVITNSNSSNGGSIKILDWKVENQSNGGGQQIKTVQFKGEGITVEKLTINAQNADVTQVANAFTTDDNANKANIFAHTQIESTDQSVKFTGDMLRGLVANIDGSKTAAAALNRTLITTATARATFLD